MKYLVSGSRTINDFDFVASVIGGVINREGSNGAVIIHGGAKGVDSCAERYAKVSGIVTEIFPPNYKKHGRSAPIIRNSEMVDKCDILIAIWDGKSRGTYNTMEVARGKKPIYKVIVPV